METFVNLDKAYFTMEIINKACFITMDITNCMVISMVINKAYFNFIKMAFIKVIKRVIRKVIKMAFHIITIN